MYFLEYQHDSEGDAYYSIVSETNWENVLEARVTSTAPLNVL